MPAKAPIRIAVLAGDGIGIDVMNASLPVFDALNLHFELLPGDIGWSCWRTEGTPLPERTWQLIKKADVTLLGATTSKPLRDAQAALPDALKHNSIPYLSPIIQLRQQLDLFANVRPCFNFQSKHPFNVCIIRENTEGLYSGLDYYPLPEPLQQFIMQEKNWQTEPHLSCTLRLQSEKGLKRIIAFAFDYANKHQMQRVTWADKPNVLHHSSAFARDIVEAEASRYPHIKADILNIDAVALWLIKRPEEFGVIVAENMFGDILSDVGAGVMGGLGLAPSANLGEKHAYFEPVHGSAPRLKPNQANPSAMLLSIGMMLDYLGFSNEADRIKQAVKIIIKKGRYITYDLGGHSTTNEMAQAIIDECVL